MWYPNFRLSIFLFLRAANFSVVFLSTHCHPLILPAALCPLLCSMLCCIFAFLKALHSFIHNRHCFLILSSWVFFHPFFSATGFLVFLLLIGSFTLTADIWITFCWSPTHLSPSASFSCPHFTKFFFFNLFLLPNSHLYSCFSALFCYVCSLPTGSEVQDVGWDHQDQRPKVP